MGPITFSRASRRGCRLRRWRLRTGLLAPILLLVPLVLGGIAVSWESVTRRETEALVEQRQAGVLAGLTVRLNERRQTNETIAYFLSRREGLGTALEAGDTLRLARTLVVMQATMNVGYINMYSANGVRVFHAGVSRTEYPDTALVARAMYGIDSSDVLVTDEGIVVAAAMGVSGSVGHAGVLVVGSPIAASDLRDGNSTEELATFRDGRLLDTSVRDPQLVEQLRQAIDAAAANGEPNDTDALNPILAPLHLRAAARAFGRDELLVALIPVGDLEQAAQERALVVVGGTLALLVALVLVGILQARAIARPVESLLSVAGALMRGEYDRRVAPTRNIELDELGSAVNHLAAELERKVAELVHQATHDPLSGLPNRALFIQRVEEALARAAADEPVAVLFIDLDAFKVVNDSLGHAVGDRLIVTVAERLRTRLAASSADASPAVTIARLGGDEFTILLPKVADAEAARGVAARVTAALAEPFVIDDHELFVGGSIGIALSGAEPVTGGDLLRAADVAMYRAKAAGAGSCVVYDPGMGRHAAERLVLETELRRAIERGGLSVHYQPIVDLATTGVRGFEALVRWTHPERGLMSPAAFIPLAEETGLIVPLGQWVLDQACQQLQAWRHDDPARADLTISVNLSTRQLRQPDLVESVANILARTGLPAANLQLEITESVLMRDADAGTLRRLAALGIKLAIDDFGTGYSSLAYLSRLPIDTLKIDRSFVSRLGQDHESGPVVRTIIGLAHTLNLNVTAEGIEQPHQAAHLLALGCGHGQGYLWAKPRPASEVVFDFEAPKSRAA